MADFYVESSTTGAYFLPMEERVARLEGEMRDVKSLLFRLEPMIIRIDATLTSTLPQLATRAEMASMRADITKEIADTRTDLAKEIADTRSDLAKDIADTRADLAKDIADTRADLTKDIADTRADLGKDISDLRVEMHQKLMDLPTKTYMWGILAVLITAYGSGLATLAVLK